MDDRSRRLEEIKRKRNIRKRNKAKKIFIRLLICLVIISVFALTILSLTVFFPIKNIVVKNPEPYSAEQIVSASGINKGENLFMSGRKAEENITVKLPYVSKIDISRKLPSKIIINVTKASPAVTFEKDNKFYLCDTNNKLLEICNEAPEGVTVVSGCDFKNPKVGYNINIINKDGEKNVKIIFEALKNKNHSIEKIDVSNLVSLTFIIDGKYKVNLGSASNIENKISHLEEMLKNISEDVEGEINLSLWTEKDPRGIFKQGSIK